jgi:hypothetical protein
MDAGPIHLLFHRIDAWKIWQENATSQGIALGLHDQTVPLGVELLFADYALRLTQDINLDLKVLQLVGVNRLEARVTAGRRYRILDHLFGNRSAGGAERADAAAELATPVQSDKGAGRLGQGRGQLGGRIWNPTLPHILLNRTPSQLNEWVGWAHVLFSL